MKQLLSFLTLVLIKFFSRIFFRFEVKWLTKKARWENIKMIVLLNHTSLLEPLYIGYLPTTFLWRLSKRMVAPGADKTLNRPLVGFFYKIFSPGMTPITRKRDDSWVQFMESIYEDSIIVIIPEGRMKRPSGLDLNGNKMTVKGGVTDVLRGVNKGEMLIAYSGGLHHIHIPGDKKYHFFKTLKLNLEVIDIAAYKSNFGENHTADEWKKAVIDDLQIRLETKVPTFD
jgi:1-acyl-sn-glycerol-3-phosphate acyltransferase